MECNKEEATRAKEIAERRMLNKDFVGARKIALKAQQLCPDLESISHMILVCDVHCSSANKVCGDEKDWYSILNIDPSADESSIKKQYRKYALSLHPDKNSFAGSTDAFKLIGEAQMVLLDRNKRLIYDSKYKASSQRGNSNVPQQTGGHNHSANKGFDTKKQQSRASNDKSTFWTLCPSCCIKYRFSADLVNTSLWCKTCKLYFTGREIKGEVTPTQKKERKPKKWIPKNNSQRDRENSTSKGVFQETNSHGKRTRESVQTRESPEINKKSKFYEKCANVGVKTDKFDVGCRPQRCTQSKIHSYYSKPSFDDQFSEQDTPEVKTDYYQYGDECNEKGEIKSTNYGRQSSSEVYLVSDPDFSNFDEYRREECFEIGQIWAVYDTIDAMPRFYALIKEVFLPGFKLLITWLEPNPDDKEECNWVCEGLPVSCGKFKLGDSEFIEDRLMLSHLVNYERESGSHTYRINPKKGEAWALFKNWDDVWQSDEDIKKKFEFEYVEILSDYANDNGVSISYLGKAKGFSCLFCQSVKGLDSFQILPNQLFRFSHRVPSFQMSGDEREDVPIGSFELDPCSLLPNLEEFEISVFPNTCLDSNFNDFNMNKREECFSVGQIWALYDSLDAMPRFYALLEEVSFSPVFEVQLTWVEPDPDPSENEEIKWVYEGLPVSCGKFKLGNSETIQDHLMFSHLVLEEKASGTETYQIYPRKGETWALFKDWNNKRNSNVEGKINYEFEFVEILSDYDAGLGVSVAYLRKVVGFSCLFCREEYKTKSLHIRPKDIFRFSHKVPSFRMNDEEQIGVPKGSFELDPGSLPSTLK